MIRPADITDLPRLEPLARQFYAASRFLGEFHMEQFIHLWGVLLLEDRGVVFLLLDGEEIVGALGGVVYPDTYSAVKVATEFFWFVGEGHRGAGLKLYRAFEEWATAQGCRQIRMVHLADSMPDQLARVYSHLGFEAAEVHYVKCLEKGV